VVNELLQGIFGSHTSTGIEYQLRDSCSQVPRYIITIHLLSTGYTATHSRMNSSLSNSCFCSQATRYRPPAHCAGSQVTLSLYLSSTEAATPSLSIIVPSLPSTTLLPIFTSTDLQPKLSASLHGRSLHQFPQRLLLPLRPSVQRSSPCLLYLFQLRLLRLPTPTAALSSDQGSPPPPQQPHAAVDNNPSAAP
jgi:hypothetical protein